MSDGIYRCMHEMAAVASLPEHPNIVAYYRAWQQAAHFYIQMALCEGGSLADLIEKVIIVKVMRISFQENLYLMCAHVHRDNSTMEVSTIGCFSGSESHFLLEVP